MAKQELFFTVLKFFTDFLPHYSNNPGRMAQRISHSSQLVSTLLECSTVHARELLWRYTRDLTPSGTSGIMKPKMQI